MRSWGAALFQSAWTLDTVGCGRSLLGNQAADNNNQTLSDKDLITIVSCVVGFLLVLLLALAGLYLWWECKKQASVDESLTVSPNCPRVASVSTERVSQNSLPRHTPVYKAGGMAREVATSPTQHIINNSRKPSGSPARYLDFVALQLALEPLRTHAQLETSSSEPGSMSDPHVQSLTPLPRRAYHVSNIQGTAHTLTDQPQVSLELNSTQNTSGQGDTFGGTTSGIDTSGHAGDGAVILQPTRSVEGPLQPGSTTSSKGGHSSPLVCKSSHSQEGIKYHHLRRDDPAGVTAFVSQGAMHGPTSLGPSHALASTSTSRGSPPSSAMVARSSSVHSLPCKRLHQDQVCDVLGKSLHRTSGGATSPAVQRQQVSSPLGRRHRPDGVIEMPLHTPRNCNTDHEPNLAVHELRFHSTREVVRYQSSGSLHLSTGGESEVCAMGSPRKTSSVRSTQEGVRSMGGILDDICRHTSSLGGCSTSGPAGDRQGLSAGAASVEGVSEQGNASVRGTHSSAGTNVDFCLPLPPMGVTSPRGNT